MFFYLNSIGFLDEIPLCCRDCSVYCMIFSSISGFQELEASRSCHSVTKSRYFQISPREQNLPRSRSTEIEENVYRASLKIVLIIYISHWLKFKLEATSTERLTESREQKSGQKQEVSVTITRWLCFLHFFFFLFWVHIGISQEKKKSFHLCLFYHNHCFYPFYRFYLVCLHLR